MSLINLNPAEERCAEHGGKVRDCAHLHAPVSPGTCAVCGRDLPLLAVFTVHDECRADNECGEES